MTTEFDDRAAPGLEPQEPRGQAAADAAASNGSGFDPVVAASQQLSDAGARLAEHNAALTEWAAYLGGLRLELAAAETRDRDVEAQLGAMTERLDALERLVAEGEARLAPAAAALEALPGLAGRVAELEALRADLGRAVKTLDSLLAPSRS